MELIDLDVHLLIVLDIMDASRMYLNNVIEKVNCDEYALVMPLVRKIGHVYLAWKVDTFYSMVELNKFHRHFHHPKPDHF